jgi:TonB-dependent receptor
MKIPPSLIALLAVLTAAISPLVAQPKEEQPIVLDRFVVTSQSQAQSAALDLYRASDALKSVVSADEIGQFVDQNAAEALQRLPGISVTRDQGEGRFVTIRGIESGLNTTTINGMRIGSSEDSSREVPLDIIPTGSVQRLEVIKVPTPDMPGDSIGGAIDISSASAFDRPVGTVSYRLGGTYSALTEDLGPKLEFGYSTILGSNENFGLSFGFNYQDRNFGSDNVETEYDFLENGTTGSDVLAPIESQYRLYDVNRERLGANLNLDYRLSDDSELYFRALFSEFTDAETRQRLILIFEDGNLENVAGGVATYSSIEAGGFRKRVRFRTQDKDIIALAAGGKHQFENWTVDYQLGYSEATETSPDEIEGRFEYNGGDDLDATVAFGSGRPNIAISRAGNPDTSHATNANQELNRVVREAKVVEETDANLSLNAARIFDLTSGKFTLKFGADGRFKEKDVDVTEYEERDVPGLSLADFTADIRSFPFGNLGEGISSAAFREVYYANRTDFRQRPKDVAENNLLNTIGDFSATEDVVAAYLMATYDTGPWRFIVGGRLEDTDFSGTGGELELDADGDFTGVTPRRVTSSYDNFLPALHARYNLGESTVIRAAWSNSIARPSFGDLSPNALVNLEDNEVEAGNPNLDPYESTNFDLIIDWYLPSSGVFSAGVFHKDIDNYIVNFTSDSDPEFPGFDVERPINGTSAEVTGFEFNWEQRLSSWSDVFDGFFFGANLTLLDSKFTLAERAGETFDLPLASETVYNVYVGYERGPLSLRLSLNRRGEYLDEIGDDTNFDIYVAEHTQLDLTASWRIRPGLDLNVEVVNLTDEPLELYQGRPGNNLQLEEYGPTINFALRGSF